MMASYVQLIGASMFLIITASSEPLDHRTSSSNIAINEIYIQSDQLRSSEAVRNVSSVLEELQDEIQKEMKSLQNYKSSNGDNYSTKSNQENMENAIESEAHNRTKRSVHHRHNHCNRHSLNFHHSNLTCPASVPSGNIHQRQEAITEWINLIARFDYADIARCQKINSKVYLNERSWTHWIVYSSCPTKFTFIYNNETSEHNSETLLGAQCASTQRECRQVTVKVSKNKSQWHHPIGCLYAHVISVESRATTEAFISK